MGDTYRNRKQAKNFVHFIALTERQQTVQEFNEARFVAILYDGSTDSAVTEEEIVYARYFTLIKEFP